MLYYLLADSTSKTETVCAGHERKREVYVSASHKMEVRLVVKRQEELGYFMLKYEGKDYIHEGVIENLNSRKPAHY